MRAADCKKIFFCDARGSKLLFLCRSRVVETVRLTNRGPTGQVNVSRGITNAAWMRLFFMRIDRNRKKSGSGRCGILRIVTKTM